MREELCALHDAVTAHLQELETMLSGATVNRADLANVRWRLSLASKQRLSMLDRRIYPYLAGLMSEAEARAVRQLQEAAGLLVAQTVSHVCTWTVDHIVSDLAGYRRASAMMRATMRARVKLERDVLYPLLIQYRGSKTPVGADLFARCEALRRPQAGNQYGADQPARKACMRGSEFSTIKAGGHGDVGGPSSCATVRCLSLRDDPRVPSLNLETQG